MKNQLFLIILVFILLPACQKDNPKVSDTGRKIVINGLITTDSLLNVFINKSTSISSYDYVYNDDLESAEAYIYENNNKIDSLHHLIKGWSQFDVFHHGNYWSENLYPSPGKEYKIVVKVPGLPDATAVTTIPEPVRIEKIDTSRIVFPPRINNVFDFCMVYNIEFTDPGNETNYYLLNLSNKYDAIIASGGNDLIGFSSEDPIIEEKLSYIGLGGLVFSDKMINGKKYNLTVTTNCRYGSEKVTMHFRLLSITEECYKYIQTLVLYVKKEGNPFFEPVTVYSNITGGYGIFTGASVSEYSVDSIPASFPN